MNYLQTIINRLPIYLKIGYPAQVHQFPPFLLLWNLQREAAHQGGHFLITTPPPQPLKSKIYRIHDFKGFLPSDKNDMSGYNRLTFVLIF